MPLIHIVMFKINASLGEEGYKKVCSDILSLKDKCLHPDTGKPYIIEATGGKDNSPEGLSNDFTHAFVMKFHSAADRDYYVKTDPAHQAFVKSIVGDESIGAEGQRVLKACVVDYHEGVY